VSDYQARQGDLIWLDFNPQAGYEQAGRRPALVVSNADANRFLRKRAMVCPITSTDKGIPLQPRLDERTRTEGVILCDQARVLDLQARGAEYIEQVPGDILFEAVDIIYGMIELPSTIDPSAL
jgi:mRNA interferase MazF